MRKVEELMPHHWVTPCGSQCTHKYAALTQIPWRVFCKKGCGADVETWDECVSACDHICFKDPVLKDQQWSAYIDRSPGASINSEQCFHACVAGCGYKYDMPANKVEEVHPNRPAMPSAAAAREPTTRPVNPEVRTLLRRFQDFTEEKKQNFLKGSKSEEKKMLAIFQKGLVDPPKELNSPTSEKKKKAKSPEEIVRAFQLSQPSSDTLSIGFGDTAFLSYFPSKGLPPQQRLFCSTDDMYCLFQGSLDNFSTLLKQYGLAKSTNEAMFIVEAYRTLRDRGPYPADRVLNDLDGSFGFVIYDRNAGSVFVALGADQRVQLFWGIAADGSAVISDSLDVMKEGCAKSFAPFPAGCFFHSEVGLMSFEHPKNKLKAMPRVDSEGIVCGANFKVDVSSKIDTIPRVGSEANWALSGR
ncbi:hypothetical protein Nepgr_021360 [Nepenthes gracilis]|uniref:DUF3700 domain-containing protein n=1 Tax=Nepenthes gracilis TaxID=150966 RepID=A0AAD3SZC9_NEPGR|nr:hypothetical protein Nepgr_021360 [Nepenthes gracilis]